MIEVRVVYGDTTACIDFPCSENCLFSKLAELRVEEKTMIEPKLFVEKVFDYEELSGLEEVFVNLDELNYY